MCNYISCKLPHKLHLLFSMLAGTGNSDGARAGPIKWARAVESTLCVSLKIMGSALDPLKSRRAEIDLWFKYLFFLLPPKLSWYTSRTLNKSSTDNTVLSLCLCFSSCVSTERWDEAGGNRLLLFLHGGDVRDINNSNNIVICLQVAGIIYNSFRPNFVWDRVFRR